ncbi:uncharacterized protein LOC141892038 [Acropora palmata]|uniref:uncharacterized protein LOC141892038 n=1 Tax=Acropora palmata TaxID=6131 RepID=UPI003DA0130C
MNERKKIINKYISISQQGKPHPNTRLSRSLQDKLSLRTTPKRPATWTSLVLKNFIADDTKTTYGCTAEVYGNFIRDGPIHLDIAAIARKLFCVTLSPLCWQNSFEFMF